MQAEGERKRGVATDHASCKATERQSTEKPTLSHGGLVPELPLTLQASAVGFLCLDDAAMLHHVSSGGRALCAVHFQRLRSFARSSSPRVMQLAQAHCVNLTALDATATTEAADAEHVAQFERLVRRNLRSLHTFVGASSQRLLRLLVNCPQLSAVPSEWSVKKLLWELKAKHAESVNVAYSSADTCSNLAHLGVRTRTGQRWTGSAGQLQLQQAERKRWPTLCNRVRD